MMQIIDIYHFIQVAYLGSFLTTFNKLLLIYRILYTFNFATVSLTGFKYDKFESLGNKLSKYESLSTDYSKLKFRV